jgi:hypothetical protein
MIAAKPQYLDLKVSLELSTIVAYGRGKFKFNGEDIYEIGIAYSI